MYIVLTLSLSVTRVKLWILNNVKGEECNPHSPCFKGLYWIKLTLLVLFPLHNLHTWNVTVIHSLSPSGWSIANWRNTLGRSGWTSWCCHLRTGEGSPITCGLGCPCGIDRISYFTDFAVPIDCCWCGGHTCHRCNRQHWFLIQLVEGWTRMRVGFLLQSSSVVLQPKAQNEKVKTLAWSLIWSFAGWSRLETWPSRNLAQLLVSQQWLFLQTFPCTSLTKTGCPGSNSMVSCGSGIIRLSPTKTIPFESWRCQCCALYWMEFEEGLNVAFFLSTSLMEMGELMKLE